MGTTEDLTSIGDTAAPERVDALDALGECEQVSTACAMAMAGLGGMPAEVRRALDCADVSAAAHRVLARGEGGDQATLLAVLDAAIGACDASAASCGAHADHHEHCRRHAESASACADAVRALRATL